MSVDADGPTSHGSVAASEVAAADGIYNFGPITHPNLYSANLLPDQPNPGAPTYSRGHTVITPVESFEASWDQGKTWFPCTKIGLCLAADRDQKDPKIMPNTSPHVGPGRLMNAVPEYPSLQRLASPACMCARMCVLVYMSGCAHACQCGNARACAFTVHFTLCVLDY